MSAGGRPDPLHLLDLAQARVAATIADLGDDDWGRPTPCTEWSVRDVVNKMTASTQLFAAFGRRERPDPAPDLVDPAEILGDDPLAVYLDAAADCRSAWRADGALEGTAPSTVGEFPAAPVLNARIFDTTILGWDVAVACSLDHRIDDVQAAYVLRVARALVPTVRAASPDRYGDPTLLDDDRPVVDRMVAVTGRDPAWRPPRPGART